MSKILFSLVESTTDPTQETRNNVIVCVDESGSMGTRLHGSNNRLSFFLNCIKLLVRFYTDTLKISGSFFGDRDIKKYHNYADLIDYLSYFYCRQPRTATYPKLIGNALKEEPDIFIFYGDGEFSDNTLSSILKENISSNLKAIYILFPPDTSIYTINRLKIDVGEAVEVASNKFNTAIKLEHLKLSYDNAYDELKRIFEESSQTKSYFPRQEGFSSVGEFFSFHKSLTVNEIVDAILKEEENFKTEKFFDFVLKTFDTRALAVKNPLWGKIHKIAYVLSSRIEGDYADNFTILKNAYPKGSLERTALEEIKELSLADDAVTTKIFETLKDFVIGYLVTTSTTTRKDVAVSYKSKLLTFDLKSYLENHKIIPADEANGNCLGFPILRAGLEKEKYQTALQLFFAQFPPVVTINDKLLMFSLIVRILACQETVKIDECVYNALINAIDFTDIEKFLLAEEIDDIFYHPANYISIANFLSLYKEKYFPKDKECPQLVYWETIRKVAHTIYSLRKLNTYKFSKTILVKEEGKSSFLLSDIKVGQILLLNAYPGDPCPTMPSLVIVLKVNSKKIKVEYLDEPSGTNDTHSYFLKRNSELTFIKDIVSTTPSPETIEEIRTYLISLKKNPPCDSLIFNKVNPPVLDAVKQEEIMISVRKICFPDTDGKIKMVEKNFGYLVPVTKFIHIFGYSETVNRLVKSGNNLTRKDIEEAVLNQETSLYEGRVVAFQESDNNITYILTSEEIARLKEEVSKGLELPDAKNMLEAIEGSKCSVCQDDIMHRQAGDFKICRHCFNPIHQECLNMCLSRTKLKPGEYFATSSVKFCYCNRIWNIEDIPDPQIKELLIQFPNGPEKGYLWRACKYRGSKCCNIINALNLAENGCADEPFCQDTCQECLNRAPHEEIMNMEICYNSPEGPSIHDGRCVHISGNEGYYCLMCTEGDENGSYDADEHTYRCTEQGAFPDIKLSDDYTVEYDWMNPNPLHFYLFSDNVNWEATGKTMEEFKTLARKVLGSVEFERLQTFPGFNF